MTWDDVHRWLYWYYYLSFIVFDGVFRIAEQGTTTDCRQTPLTDRRIMKYNYRALLRRTSQKSSKYTRCSVSLNNISDKIMCIYDLVNTGSHPSYPICLPENLSCISTVRDARVQDLFVNGIISFRYNNIINAALLWYNIYLLVFVFLCLSKWCLIYEINTIQ